MKNKLALAASILAILFCVKLQWGLEPRWQEALIQILASGMLLTALLAFIRLDSWPAFIGIFITVAFYDVYLLISPPLPRSLVIMYTVMTLLAVILYLSVREQQFRAMFQGFGELFSNPQVSWHRMAILALFPLWFSSMVLATRQKI